MKLQQQLPSPTSPQIKSDITPKYSLFNFLLPIKCHTTMGEAVTSSTYQWCNLCMYICTWYHYTPSSVISYVLYSHFRVLSPDRTLHTVITQVILVLERYYITLQYYTSLLPLFSGCPVPNRKGAIIQDNLGMRRG